MYQTFQLLMTGKIVELNLQHVQHLEYKLGVEGVRGYISNILGWITGSYKLGN